jgi:LPS export ABC transporter permease LptF/LPS export ABC transporter permease LptG
MRLLSRSVLREIWGPFLLGFAAYTFILLVRTIYFLADFFVRRSATFGEVVWLVVLSLPWIVVLTLPMAFLLGVLIGIGRLAGDSELVAMRACGVGPTAIYRPVLGAAAALSAGVFVLYNFVLPPANETLTRSMTRVAATSVVNVVHPRVFREVRPGVTLFFDRTGEDGRSLEGVFVKLGDDLELKRIIVARRGALTLEGDRLWLDLFSSTLHDFDSADPARYRTNRNQTHRVLIAGDLGGSANVSYDKSLRSQSIAELLDTARRVRARAPENYRLAWVEIHKKISIPLACLVFAIVGIPLAESSRRGGRGSGFAISLAIIVVYYVLLSSGETWAEEGRLPAGLAIWLPNLVLALLGAAAILWSRRERGRWQFRLWRAPSALRRPAVPETGARVRFGGLPRFPALIDRYVLVRFLSVLGLVVVSVLLLAVIVDYADHIEKIARNHPSGEVLFGYYRYFLLSIGVQIAPFAVLIATLVALGIFSKNNEDTAFKASGVSLHRVGAPVVAATVLAAGFLFTLGEYVLPFAEQREMRYRNVIYGRDPDWGVGTLAERNWFHGGDGRIWHREESDPSRKILLSPSVFEFDRNFDLVRRDAAREAVWNGQAWIFRQGWTRTFGGPLETSYRAFLDEVVPGDPPQAFAREKRTPEQMRFRELQRYVRRLRASGYPTGELETALAAKLSFPLLLPLMALLALPFAFQIGRRGALAGIGVGLGLGMVLQIATAFFTKLGEVGALPPLLAAWSPDVLAATASAYLLLKLRT